MTSLKATSNMGSASGDESPFRKRALAVEPSRRFKQVYPFAILQCTNEINYEIGKRGGMKSLKATSNMGSAKEAMCCPSENVCLRWNLVGDPSRCTICRIALCHSKYLFNRFKGQHDESEGHLQHGLGKRR